MRTVRLLVDGKYDGPAVEFIPHKTSLPVTKAGKGTLEYYEGDKLIAVNEVGTPHDGVLAPGDTVSI